MLTLPRDLRYAARQLRNSPGFTVAAVLTLALGIGATTAIFSVVYGLLLASLPFHDAARVISIAETHPQVPGSGLATYPDYQEWKSQQSSFSEIAAYSTLNPATVSLATNGRAEQVHRVLRLAAFGFGDASRLAAFASFGVASPPALCVQRTTAMKS